MKVCEMARAFARLFFDTDIRCSTHDNTFTDKQKGILDQGKSRRATYLCILGECTPTGGSR